MKAVLALGLSLVVALAAACSVTVPIPPVPGSPSTGTTPELTANPAEQALNGYLAQTNNGISFLQWTRNGDALSGSLITAAISQTFNLATGLTPSYLAHKSVSFTGIISDNSVTLNFPEALAVSNTMTGAFSGDALTLSFPAADGSLSTLTFSPATVADYNAALAVEQAQVQAVQDAAAVAQASAQAIQDAAAAAQASAQAVRQAAQASAAAVAEAQKQEAQEERTIDYYSGPVTNDLATLARNVASMQQDLNAVLNDLTSMSGDVDSTYKDLQTVISEARQYPDGNSGGVCADASGVAANASSVNADESGIEADGSGLEADKNPINGGYANDDLTLLRSDFSNLQTAEAALPSYVPSGTPSSSQVSKAISSANEALAAEQQTFAKYLTQAKQMVRTANGYAAAADGVCTQVGG